MQAIIEKLGTPDNLGVCLDTGNSWVGGTDPVKMAKKFRDKIGHVHWKDLQKEWEKRRGSIFGCGGATNAIGTGVIDIKGVFEVLKDAPKLKYSTLEVQGEENLISSYNYLKTLGAE
jgi:inosose dehydratase